MKKPYGNEVAKCPHCSAPIGNEHPYVWCIECGEKLPTNIIELIPNLKTKIEDNQSSSKFTTLKESQQTVSNGEGLIITMQVFAFINLIAGIVIGIKSFGTIEGDIGTITGIAFIIEAILGCTLLLVIALIAENIVAIRKKIENYFKNNV